MAIWYDIVDIIANGPTTVKKRAETPRDSGEKILVIIGEEAIVISWAIKLPVDNKATCWKKLFFINLNNFSFDFIMKFVN